MALEVGGVDLTGKLPQLVLINLGNSADVQLGKGQVGLRNLCISKALWLLYFVGDQLGARRLAGLVH